MARDCQLSLGTSSGRAQWQLAESELIVTPEGRSPLVYALRELQGIFGDGYEIRLKVPGPTGSPDVLTLSRLGAEGPTLLDALQRAWLVERSAALRLSGAGEAKPFSGTVAGLGIATPVDTATRASAEAQPFRGLLYEDVLLVATEGDDVEPVFLALLDSVSFDDAAYVVRLARWPAGEVVVSKLGRRTEEFVKDLTANRAVLARESAETLAVNAGSLAAGARAALAGSWLPGRLLDFPAMEQVCPGFAKAFQSEWLARLPRRQEAEFLAGWAPDGPVFLGCSRPQDDTAGAEASTENDGQMPPDNPNPPGLAQAIAGATTGARPAVSEGPATAPSEDQTESQSAASSGTAGAPVLWMLCGKAEHWFLEALSEGDRATYHFRSGPEIVALVSQLLCAPQFSREALYLPLDSLSGDRNDLRIAAQYLGFLVDLRARLFGRVIHQTLASWSACIQSATR